MWGFTQATDRSALTPIPAEMKILTNFPSPADAGEGKLVRIRDTKLKVTTQIQGEEVRVNGKSRDDLQAVIAAVSAKEFPVALQFQNFRD